MDAISINAVNTLWFGMGANFFGRKPMGAAKLFRPDLKLSSPEMSLVPHSMPFLGGFNLALSLLSLARLVESCKRHARGEAVFTSNEDVQISATIMLCHFTQFFSNIRHLKGRAGGAPWDVKGTMLFIFITDFVCALLNFILLRKAVAFLKGSKQKKPEE
eukprot:TRINITY_DN10804_c0_g1_i1.p1 TRINITY_DN10804_c0_g1~~TRINITY_DN10804_c0_g1_i1.p1  ORF type:complete len:177 (+),score=33.38 TRINITY_DN10804_c0_g1_i1:54-533(+)